MDTLIDTIITDILVSFKVFNAFSTMSGFILSVVILSASAPVTLGCENSELSLIQDDVAYNATYTETLRSKTITTSLAVGVDVINEFIPKLCCEMLNLTQEIHYLTFKRCYIEEIEVCFSERVHDIKDQLTIVNNRITTIKTNTFKNLNVQVIFLNGNSI